MKIYYEDKDIIVVHKPAFVNAQVSRGTKADMESMIKNYLYSKEKKANPYVAVVHRLDNTVEGIMVYAKTKEAAGNLSEQIRNHKLKKTYLAAVDNGPGNEEYVYVENYLIKDNSTNTSKVVDKGHKEAKKGVLEYKKVHLNKEGKTVLMIKLHTGRHHQIRVTLADLGFPIIGDKKYNEAEKEGKEKTNICLMSYRLEFNHPRTKKEMSFEVDELPKWAKNGMNG